MNYVEITVTMKVRVPSTTKSDVTLKLTNAALEVDADATVAILVEADSRETK